MRLLLSVFLSLLFTCRAAGQTLHLLLVSDVEDARFGMISLQDEERMARLFGSAEAGLGYKMQTTYLNKTTFTGESVRKTIANLVVQPDDIIVFFYSGLGYYPTTSTGEFPFLQLKDWQKRPISLEETGTLLKAKGVRFCMAMADCRNESITKEPYKIPDISAITVVRQHYTKLILKHLFLKKCGLMTIASAARNQNTLVVTTSDVNEKTLVELKRETGSAFTRLFYSAFEQMDYMDLDNLANADFDLLLQQVQAAMPYLINQTPSTNREQTVVWKTQPCEATIQTKIRQLPVFTYPKNLNELEKTLNQLIAVKENDKRRMMISVLLDLYGHNLVVMQNENGISFKNYLKTLSTYNPKLKKIEIKNTGFRQERILNNFMPLEIQEIKEPNPRR